MRPRRAFTLVELVVVIVVLLVLMAIAVPAFLTMRDSSRDTSALSDLNVTYRNAAALIDADERYGTSAADLAARLGASEPNITTLAAPAPAAPGAVQVALHDDGRTAHLCTMSATGVSFCLAMNSRGALDDGLPTVGLVPVFRSWGHTPQAATCWLPTMASVPGADCATPAERRSGGSGWVAAPKVAGDDPGELPGGGDPGDGDAGGTLEALPTNAGFEDLSEAGFVGWENTSVGGGQVARGDGHTGASAAHLSAHRIGSPVGYGSITSAPFQVDTTRNLVLYATGKAGETAFLTVQFVDANGDVVATPVDRQLASERPVYLPPPWQQWVPVVIDTSSLNPGAYRLRLSVASPNSGMGYGVWFDSIHYEGDTPAG